MPKERIYPDTPQSIDESTGLPIDQVDFIPEVAWTKDISLTLGMTVPNGESIVRRIYGHDAEAIGRGLAVRLQALARQNGGDWQAPEFFDADTERGFYLALGEASILATEDTNPVIERDGLWWAPTRQQLNRLIATLRRAGRGAFGKDEW